MTYETTLALLLATGLIGLGFLLWFFLHIRWHLGWLKDELGVIIFDSAMISYALWFFFITVLLSRHFFGVLVDARPWYLAVSAGFAFGTWTLLLRYLYWRFYENGDDEWT